MSMERLLDVAGELAAATTREDVARLVIDKGIGAVAASYGGIWLLDGKQLHMLAVSPLPRGTADAWMTVPLELDAPLPEVARTGKALFLESLAEYEQRFPASFARMR